MLGVRWESKDKSQDDADAQAGAESESQSPCRHAPKMSLK